MRHRLNPPIFFRSLSLSLSVMTITVMSAMEAMQTAAFRPLGRRVIAGSNPTSEQDQSGGGTATLRMAHSSRFLTGVNFIFLSSSGGDLYP